MNIKLSEIKAEYARYARSEIKKGLSLLEDRHILLFKRMYSHKDLDRGIDDIVDDMHEDDLEWALTQTNEALK